MNGPYGAARLASGAILKGWEVSAQPDSGVLGGDRDWLLSLVSPHDGHRGVCLDVIWTPADGRWVLRSARASGVDCAERVPLDYIRRMIARSPR